MNRRQGNTHTESSKFHKPKHFTHGILFVEKNATVVKYAVRSRQWKVKHVRGYNSARPSRLDTENCLRSPRRPPTARRHRSVIGMRRQAGPRASTRRPWIRSVGDVYRYRQARSRTMPARRLLTRMIQSFNATPRSDSRIHVHVYLFIYLFKFNSRLEAHEIQW